MPNFLIEYQIDCPSLLIVVVVGFCYGFRFVETQDIASLRKMRSARSACTAGMFVTVWSVWSAEKGTIDDLVWLMKRSSYLKNTILGMVVRLVIENKEIITRELLKPEDKKDNDTDDK